jgi:ribose-phosphate pyrophosphokinase
MNIFTVKDTFLVREISKRLDISTDYTLEIFKDGEFLPKFNKSIRGQDIYLISQTSSSDDIMATCLTIDAAKRAGVGSITLVLPYYSYSRQDKADHIRSSVGSKMIADIYEKIGINQVITIDLHNPTIAAFFNIPVIHLNGNRIFTEYIKSLNLSDICIVSPDHGAIKKNVDFAKSFPNSSFGVINKKRIKPNEIHSMELIGDVTDKNVIIVDDLIDTGGTIAKAAKLLMDAGAKSVRAIATHGVLSGAAYENIENSVITELIVSDTIDLKRKSDKIKIISSAEVLTRAILSLESRKSINEINEAVA